jgi:hypothetical protein
VDRAPSAGKRLGRLATGAKVFVAIRASLTAGISVRRAAALHHVGIRTVQRVRRMRML